MNDKLMIEMLTRAYDYARLSPDPSNQNGAILINDDGDFIMGACNEPPQSIVCNSETFSNRTEKYARIEHAERHVILKCAAQGIQTSGLIMVCPWYACSDCARAIILADIKMVIGHRPRFRQYDLTRNNLLCDKTTAWTPSVSIGDKMLDEANIQRIYYEDLIGLEPILINEKRWNP